MNKLKDFMNILTGSFNNSEQFDKMKLDNIDFPYAEHVNTICNDKIINLPEDFKGIFMVEESYYTSNGNTHASPHLFLFTQEENGIKLTSYEVPNGYDKNSMFSPVLKFTLFERFSEEYLEVSETMEVRGKRTFGYDEPIIYKRVI